MFTPSTLRRFIAALIIGSAVSTELLADVPAGFLRTTVVSGLRMPTDLACLPDGRVLVLSKDGDIQIVDPAAVPPTIALYMELSVDRFGERGITSIVLDPEFSTNGFFYLYWSPSSSNRFRLSRFTHQGDSASPGSELVLWEDPTTAEACCHQGAGLDIGPDGFIYFAPGDEFLPGQSQDMTTPAGKILRIGRDGSIPEDNPFVDGPQGTLDEIWALGLRNPWRMRWDAPTNRLFIAEVGGDNSLNSSEDIHLGTIGGNYGWPDCEGDCAQPQYNDPLFSYPHAGISAAVIGGFVYRGSQFPFAYHGAYFYGDYARQELHYLSIDEHGNVLGSTVFDRDAGPVTSMIQAADGAMLYTVFGGNSGELRRISYQSGNLSPRITQATADVLTGPAPLTVHFSGAATDPEMETLQFLWDLGDGPPVAGASVSHTYGSNGAYLARLFVSDSFDTVASQSFLIEVGTRPVVTITQPLDGTLFRAGDTIAFSSTASDDGPLSPLAFKWMIEFAHNEHVHPHQTVVGPSGSFLIETTGHNYEEDTAYRLTLSVIDVDGLEATQVVEIFPEKVDVAVDTVPTGLLVLVDEIGRWSPFVLDSLIGFEHTLRVEEAFCSGGQRLVFNGWSDLGAAEHVYVVPETNDQLVATFDQAGPCRLSVTGGLVLRLDTGSGVTESGGVVTGWTDQSGRGNHLVAAGNPVRMPAGLSGRDFISFDGNGDLLRRDGGLNGMPTGNGDRSLYAVVQYRSAGRGGFSYGTVACNQVFGMIVGPGAGQAMIQGWCSDFPTTFILKSAGWLTQSAIVRAGNVTQCAYGFPIQTFSHTFATGASSLVIGAELDGLPFVAMDVAEVLLYDRALSPAEDADVISYLHDRYFAQTAPTTFTTWTGADDQHWGHAVNWTAGVPDAGKDALIPAGTPNAPELEGTTSVCRSLSLGAGAVLSAPPGTSLAIHRNATLAGTVLGTGTFRFVGSGEIEAAPGSALPALEIDGAGPFYAHAGLDVSGSLALLSGQLELDGELTVAGSASFTGGSLRASHGASDLLRLNGDALFAGTALPAVPTIESAGSWTSDASFAPPEGRVVFRRVGPQTVNAAGRFFDVVVMSGTTLDAAGGFVAVSGSLDVDGAIAAGTTVRFVGAAPRWKASSVLANATIAASGTLVVENGAGTTGNLTLQTGTLHLTGNLTVGGAARLEGGQLTTQSSAHVLEVAGALIWTNTFASAPPHLRVLGSWFSGGSFQPVSGQVTFAGGDPLTVIAIGSVFRNVTIEATPGTTVDVQGGPLTLRGTLISPLATSFSPMSAVRLTGLMQVIPDGSMLPNVTVASFGLVTGKDGVAVSGDLVHESGELRVEGALSVAGDALFSGGLLSRTGFSTVDGKALPADFAGGVELVGGVDVLMVEGDVTFAGTVAFDPPTIHCRGNWSADFAFDPARNAVVLDGGAGQVLTGTVLGFHHLRIAGGSTALLAGDLRLELERLTIEQGSALDLDSHALSIPGGDLRILGDLSVDRGGVLALGGAVSAEVTPSGRLSLRGAPGQLARVVGHAGGGYRLVISGRLEARFFEFASPAPSGVVLRSAAQLGPSPHDLREGRFSSPTPGPESALFSLERRAATEFHFVDFEDPLGVGVFNVRYAGAAGGAPITFVNSRGNFDGPDFEFDPLDRIEWTTATGGMVAWFDLDPGTEQVLASWQTLSEIAAIAFVLERSDNRLGPFSPLAEVSPVGGGTMYQVMDEPLPADVEVFYRLRERRTDGSLELLAQGSTTPWSAALPPSIMRVGPSGGYPNLQAAVNAATAAATILWVEKGTYPAFVVDGSAPASLFIVADGSGPVRIDASNLPVTIRDLARKQSVELSDLEIFNAPPGRPAIRVFKCAGVVVLDDLLVQGGGSQPKIDVRGSTAVAIQRSMVEGSILVAEGSSAAVSRTIYELLSVESASTVRAMQNKGPHTVAPGATLHALDGQMPDIELAEIVELGSTVTMSITTAPKSPWLLLRGTGHGWSLGNAPPLEMPLLLGSPQTQVGSGQSDPAGLDTHAIAVPPTSSLLGVPFVLQLMEAESSDPQVLRASNVMTFFVRP